VQQVQLTAPAAPTAQRTAHERKVGWLIGYSGDTYKVVNPKHNGPAADWWHSPPKTDAQSIADDPLRTWPFVSRMQVAYIPHFGL
jgi:hypothetical protein